MTSSPPTARPALESLCSLAARSACTTLDTLSVENWHTNVGPMIPDEILQQMVEAGQADIFGVRRKRKRFFTRNRIC